MPATTPTYGFPYPLGGDPIRDGDNVIRALAEQLDASLPYADGASRAGIDDTGVTECSGPLQTFLDSCAALGARAYLRGTFKIANTVTIACDADLSDADFNYTGTSGTAIRIGTTTAGAYLMNLTVAGPRRVLATAKTITGWSEVANCVGVELANLVCCRVTIGNICNFGTGLRCYAYGATGANYNMVTVGHLENNKVGQYLGCSTVDGAMNESTYFVKRFSFYVAEGANVAGARHLEMTVTAHPMNNNTWYSPSFENDAAEFHLIVSGNNNRFIQGRYEVTGGARVRWAADSSGNLIDGGYGSEILVETFVSGAKANNIRSTGKQWTSLGGGAGGSVIYEGGSASWPLDVIMVPGSRVAGTDPATGYNVARSANFTNMKRATDVAPRLQLDHSNGGIKAGDGTAAPTVSMRNFGNTDWYLVGGLRWETDNTYDIGGTGTVRPRDVRVGRNLYVGQSIIQAAGGQNGFYGATPINKPSVSGSRGGNAALADLLTKLASLGLITDSTTA